MDDKTSQLFEKFKNAISSNLSEEEAINFFSKLKADEYDYLIEMFQNNDFPEVKNETKEKLLLILRKLREKLYNGV